MKRGIFLLMAFLAMGITSRAQLTAPFSESFDSLVNPITWATTNNQSNNSPAAFFKFSGNPAYDAAGVADHTGNGGHFAWVDGSTPYTPAPFTVSLTSDSIDATAVTNAFLEFWMFSKNTSYASNGHNDFFVDFYDGSQWNDSIYFFSGDLAGWSYVGIDLSTYTISGKAMIRFNVTKQGSFSAQYNDILVDDIYFGNAPACQIPQGLTTGNISATTAVLKWNTVPGGSSYNVIVDTTGFDPSTSGTAYTNISVDSVLASGLASATYHDFYVYADCGVNGTGDTAGPFTFVTGCAPFLTPLVEGFETTNTGSSTNPTYPLCWNYYETPGHAGYGYVSSSSAHTGSNKYQFYVANNLTDTLGLISPEMIGLDSLTKQVHFYMRPSSLGIGLIIGTVSSQNDFKSFSPIDTIIQTQSSQYEEFVVTLDAASNYNGTDKFLAFMPISNGTYKRLYIDDLSIEDIPACPKPQILTSLVPGADFVDLQWQSNGSASVIEYGASGFSVGSGTTIAGGATSARISGLSANTTYDFYVYNDCSGSSNGTSLPQGPITVTTAHTVPYLDDFTTGTTTDWSEGQGLLSNPTTFTSTFSSWATDGFANNGTTGAWRVGVYSSSTTIDEWFISPAIDLDSGNTYQLSFDVAVTSSSGTNPVAMNPGDTLFIVAGNQLGEFNRSDVIGYFHDAVGNTNLGQTQYISLSGIDGPIQLGFYMEKQVSGTVSYDLFLDNVQIDVPALCPPAINFGFVSATDTSVAMTWLDSSVVLNYELEWGPVGFTQGTGSTATVNGDSIFITGLSPISCYDVYIRSVCSAGNGAWQGPIKVCTECTSTVGSPLVENFDGPIWEAPNTAGDYNHKLSPCWTASPQFSGTYGWLPRSGNAATFFPRTGPDHDNTTGSANYMYIESTYGSLGDTAILYSPMIDLTSLVRPEVSFYYHMYGSNIGTLYLDIWNGTSWDNLVAIVGEQHTAQTDAYDKANALLSDYVGQTVQFRFWSTRLGGNGDIAIDDFSVVDAPSCTPVTNIDGDSITSSSVKLSWASFGSNFNIEYGPVGFNQGSGVGTVVNNVSNPYTLTGLSPLTSYDVYVNDGCGNNWVGPFTFTTECVNRLSGNYTIGGTPGPNNFPTLDSAVVALSGCGISGPVKFTLSSIDTAQIELFEVKGASATNTITFEGNGPTTSGVVNLSGSALVLDGADFVEFNDLSFITDGGLTAVLTNGADNITFDNVAFINKLNSTSSLDACLVASGSRTSAFTNGNNTNNLTIVKSTFYGGYYGVRVNGFSSSSHTNGLRFENNNLQNQTAYGVYASYHDSTEVFGNTIKNFSGSSSKYGIYLSSVDYPTVENNNINVSVPSSTSGYGIYLTSINTNGTPSSKSLVANNMAIADDRGMYFSSCSHIEFFHNTAMGGRYGMYNYIPSSADEIDFRNNIFTAMGSRADYAVYVSGNFSANYVMDHNLYFSEGSNFVRTQTGTYTDLVAWQAADTNLNVNSLEGDPVFLNNSDLHVIGTLANDAGDNTVGITTDIDGDTRPATGSATVDMGADEYSVPNNDAMVTALVSPTNFTCGDTNLVVSVAVQNLGLNTISSLPVTVDMNGTLINVNATGLSIPTFAIDTIVVGNFSSVMGGNFNFSAYTSLTGDQNTSNDTLTGDVTINDASPIVAELTMDTICEGSDAFAYVAQPMTSGSYEWRDSQGNVWATSMNNDTVAISGLISDTTLYAHKVGVTSAIGHAAQGAGGSYSTYYLTRGMKFEVSAHSTIDSVTVYPTNGNGDVIVNLRDDLGNLIMSDTTAVVGASQGTPVQIYVGFNVAPGNYILDALGSMALWYQNNSGFYPSPTPDNNFIITGNTANLAGYTYSFFNWIVTVNGCPRPEGMVNVMVKKDALVASANVTVLSQGGFDVLFDGSSSVGANKYTWYFGDGNVGPGKTTSHTYTQGGTINGWLVAEDTTCGFVDSTAFTINNLFVNEWEDEKTVSIYPNPTTGDLNINLDVEGAQNVTLKVTNLMGKVLDRVDMGMVNGNKYFQYSLEGQPAGMYILEVRSERGVVTQKIQLMN